MIKVNLLKSYNAFDSDVLRDLEDLKQVRKDFVKRIIMFLIGPLGLYFYEGYNIPDLIGQKTALQSQLDQLIEFNKKKESIAKEITKYEEEQKKLNKQKAFLEKISKERTYPVELINNIQKKRPKGLWVVTIKSSNNKIEIYGEADKDNYINEFEAHLTAVPVLKNVKLLSTSVKNDNQQTNEAKKTDITIKTFIITAEYAIEEATK